MGEYQKQGSAALCTNHVSSGSPPIQQPSVKALVRGGSSRDTGSGTHLTIPSFVELVDQHAVELRQILDNPHNSLEQLGQIQRLAKLFVDLGKDSQYVHGPDVLRRLTRSFSSGESTHPFKRSEGFRSTRRAPQNRFSTWGPCLLALQSRTKREPAHVQGGELRTSLTDNVNLWSTFVAGSGDQALCTSLPRGSGAL